jgi:hypothetical protein
MATKEELNSIRKEAIITQDRTLLRIGAVLLIVGVVLPIIFGFALHPQVADPGDTEAVLQSIVDSPSWAGIHVAILAGGLLAIGGLLALYRSIMGEPGAALARLGFTAALVGGGIYLVSIAIEGSGALKALADAWAAAADKAIPFAVAEAMYLVSMDIFSGGWIIFGGVAPILFGLAITATDFYPKWLGWVAVVSGIGNALIAIVLFAQGWSLVTNNVFTLFALALTLWQLAMGVLMWRKAGDAHRR